MVHGNGPGTGGRVQPAEGAREAPTFRFQMFLNTASRERMTREFRIHAEIADKIIAHRPYESEADLLERGILPKRAYERLRREFLNSKF
jgi:DNA uptake protein ComE-like DNA-binding protein